MSPGQLDFAKDRLVTMAMSLFRKVVDTTQPFHLTLINVAVTKMEEVADKNITSFFNSQGSFSPPSQQHPQSSNNMPSQSQAPPSPLQKARNLTADPSKERECSTPKRKPNSLTTFFTKKQKVFGDGVVATTVPNAESHSRTKDGRQEMGAKNVSLPSDVDPTVFAHLPADIQQEILQTHAQQQRSDSSGPLSGSATSAVSLHVDENSSIQLREQTSAAANFFATQKKLIFSPTKSKQRNSVTGLDRSQVGRKPAVETCQDDVTSVTHSGELEAHISERPGCDLKDNCFITKAKNIKSRLLLSKTVHGDISPSSEESIPGPCSESQKQIHNFSLDSSQAACKFPTENFPSNKSSDVSCFSSPKVPVPKGVAPDVFSALPPEIQREVAAEMAIQKHSATSQGENSSSKNRGNLPLKSPGKKVNSMLNYLKKR